MRMLAVAAALLVTGCEYEVPLATQATIPIDESLIGIWDEVAEADTEALTPVNPLVILRFSPHEYLIVDSDHYMRGFFVDVGGHRLLQLEDLGTGIAPKVGPRTFIVSKAEVRGDTAIVSVLSRNRVAPKDIKTSDDLRAAIVAHRDKADLFEPLIRLQRRCALALALPEPPNEKQGDRDHVETASLAPGGRLLIAGLRSGHVAAIDLVAGRLVWSEAAHEGPVQLLAFGETDRLVLTAGSDLQATVRSGPTGLKMAAFEAVPLRAVYDIALSSDGRYAATRGFDGFGKVWDVGRNREVTALNSYGFAFGPRGRILVSSTRLEPGAEIFQIPPAGADAEPLRILPEHRVNQVAIDLAGRAVAAAGESGNQAVVWLVDPNAGRLLSTIPIPKRALATEATSALGVAFSADGKRLAAGTSDGQVVRIDLATRKVLDTWRLADDEAFHRISFVADDIQVTSLGTPHEDDEPGSRLPMTTRLFRPGQNRPVWDIDGEATAVAEQPFAAAVTREGDLMLFERSTGLRCCRVRPWAHGTQWESLPADE
jgi:WD40 repeat protein